MDSTEQIVDETTPVIEEVVEEVAAPVQETDPVAALTAD